jgi:hypothetical protein
LPPLLRLTSSCFQPPCQPPCPQIGDTLEEFLLEATPDPKLRQLMMSMSEAVRTIAYKVRQRRGRRHILACIT